MTAEETISALKKKHSGDNKIVTRLDDLLKAKKKTLIGHGNDIATAFDKILDNIDKLNSGDPTDVAIATLDVFVKISKFAALAGPSGVITGAIVGTSFSIVSSIIKKSQIMTIMENYGRLR